MACRVCGHTVERLCGPPGGWFWCPRCGAILQPGAVPEVQAPMIVARSKIMRDVLQSWDAAFREAEDQGSKCVPESTLAINWGATKVALVLVNGTVPEL
jgi:hypothetical protein